MTSSNDKKIRSTNRRVEVVPAFLEAQKRIHSALIKKSDSLDLSGLGLTSVPAEIGGLSQLIALNLQANELDSLPHEMERLTALKSLQLQRNRFQIFPQQIVRLVSLAQLDLNENDIATIPIEISMLTELKSLSICNNELEALPPSIGQLNRLQWLYVYGNRLSSIPVQLCDLRSLQVLSVFLNELSVLPAAIGNLANLSRLDVYGNRLTSLPSEISNLSNLQYLDVGKNPLGTVPPQIRSLTSLISLHLIDTNLKTLPAWLAELPLLQSMPLHGNPALKLSPSVLGTRPDGNNPNGSASAKVVLDLYFQRLVGATRPLNEVKLILVGRGGAGKTSTVRALRNEPFDENEASTPGVALCDWTVNLRGGEEVTAHVWDFAGQVITHSLHQFFFSVRSVYVLVLTGRENNERDDAEYWLRLIKAFGTDEEGNGPPVIVALNKWDVPGCRPRLDRRALQERYPFIRSFVEMDCKSEKGVTKLKAALAKEVDRLKWVREPFPKSWDAVRRALTSGRRKKVHLSYSDFRALCSLKGVTDEGHQDSLAEVLHHLGVALNYRKDARLREATVLQPEWLTKNVYSLVRKAEKQAGLLTQSDVDSVLRYEKDPEMRAYLVRIMQRFEIAYSPRGVNDAWLVPQALPDEQAQGVLSFGSTVDATRLRYIYQALPEGLVAKAIVRLNEFIEEVAGKKQMWASGVIIARQGARALIRTEQQDRQVIITVTGPTKARQQLAGLCQAEMRDIHSEIRGLDPAEETKVQGNWISTATLEFDEQNLRQTGIATADRGTLLIDPVVPNNAYSEKLARSDTWKPTIFISYSKNDVLQRKQLEIQLKILRNEGIVGKTWHDRMINPGDLWDETIQQKLQEADVVVILISPASLSTDYITQNELPQAFLRHEAGEMVVVPIILQDCRWQQTKLGALNALPEKGKALNQWKRSSDGWKSVADGLATVCEGLMRSRGSDGAILK